MNILLWISLSSILSFVISGTISGEEETDYDGYSEDENTNELNDYEYTGQWSGQQQRGDGFWRSECRSWSPDEIYQTGDKVKHGDTFYQAKWWSSNSEPGKGEWGDWKVIGNSCSAGIDVHQVEASVVEVEVDNQVENEDTNEVENEFENEDAIEVENDIENEINTDHGPHKPIDADAPPSLEQALAREASLTNSSLFRDVRRSIATMNTEEVEMIDVRRAGNPDNVRRVERLMSEEDWDYLFPVRDPEYTYRRFLQSIGKFPAVCGNYDDGRNADLICRRALATMFAHFTQETGGHNRNSEVSQWRQGLVYLREAGCTEEGPGCGYDSACDLSTWQGRTWPCGKKGGKWAKYYGRGAKQLSYNFNYGPFSDSMYGTVTKLLEKPDLVASTWLNLASATWFYTYPQPPKPSMLHVIDGTWQPNKEDRENKLEPGFGATIMIINGGIECGHKYEKPQAENRQKYYKKFAGFFKLDISGEELSCAHMSSFSKGGSGSLYIYWDREWTKEFECQLVKYQTPFNALKPGDYVKCVEDQFKVKLN